MLEPEVQQPQEPRLLPGEKKTFVTAPSQADLRPSDMESHVASEILGWQERSPKLLRVLGEPVTL